MFYAPIVQSDDDQEEKENEETYYGDNDKNDIELSNLASVTANIASTKDSDDDDYDENSSSTSIGESRIPSSDMITLLNGVNNTNESIYEWHNPWLLSALVTMLLVTPTLTYTMWMTYSLTCKIWCCSFFIIHSFVIVTISNYLTIPTTKISIATFDSVTEVGHTNLSHNSLGFNNNSRSCSCCCCCCCCCNSKRRQSYVTTTTLIVITLFDLALFGFVYPKVANGIIQVLFTDDDNTIVIEWSHVVRDFHLLKAVGYMIVGLRCYIGLMYIVVKCYIKCMYTPEEWNTMHWRPTFYNFPFNCIDDDDNKNNDNDPNFGNINNVIGGTSVGEEDLPVSSTTTITTLKPMSYSDSNIDDATSYSRWEWLFPPKGIQIVTTLKRVFSFLTFTSSVLLVWCILSLISHFGSSSSSSSSLLSWQVSMPKNYHAGDTKNCDSLDSTECILPFPSFHYLKEDPTTITGYRIDIDRRVLPLMKGGISWNTPEFISKLDGFSTMAPILFYLHGMKEGYELAVRGTEGKTVHSSYVNNRLQGPERIEYSVTNTSITLLLDVEAKELVYHSAEIDYLDVDHPLVLVFPSKPLKHNTHYALAVINATDGNGQRIISTFRQQSQHQSSDRRQGRFHDVVIPTLENAAPWFSFAKDPESLQLLFDFHTVSEESQLGSVRGVRDGTLSKISKSPSSWNWKDHVHTILVEDAKCDDSSFIARTIHAELDVPWFLDTYGPNGRSAELDTQAVLSKQPVAIGKAKFIVRVPCSLREAAIGGIGGKKLRAIMEFGHGLFASREEVQDQFLSRLANDNGYILTAMDWRGMSKFDLPVVIKVMLGEPNLFGSIRDNMIQGYANKLALQHFSANYLLKMDWLTFEHSKIPLWHYGKTPTRVFYGISQGGILGAGYSALSGPTKLIDRAVLGVPGTPFALVMSRSQDFVAYDTLLLFSFYNNRHVRIFLSLMQMGWDSVEASGLLAPPVNEQYPRLLLQAGLGDTVVPTSAAEALARALGASTLPKNPRKDIFGIPVAQPSNQTWMGPDVTLTEVLYEKEYNMLPIDDVFGPANDVHTCVRFDQQLQHQLTEFINSDRIIDPCKEDECRRDTTC